MHSDADIKVLGYEVKHHMLQDYNIFTCPEVYGVYVMDQDYEAGLLGVESQIQYLLAYGQREVKDTIVTVKDPTIHRVREPEDAPFYQRVLVSMFFGAVLGLLLLTIIMGMANAFGGWLPTREKGCPCWNLF